MRLLPLLALLLLALSSRLAAECFADRPELPERLGSAAADRLRGSAEGERICAGAGADRVLAGRGDDLVRGDGGEDRLYGDGGADRLEGGEGADSLWGGAGADLLLGAGGRDELLGGEGADELAGGGGEDLLAGGEGADALEGGAGADRLRGEEGDDLLDGGPGDDVYLYRVGDGDDRVRDREGANRLVLVRIDPAQVSTRTSGEDLVLAIETAERTATLTVEQGGVPCPTCSLAVEHDDRPNLVLVFADDLGWGDLGVYGQARIHTPELDAMAGRGRVFTDFYSAAPHCQPARNSLFTGLHTGHTHVRLDGPMSADGPLLSQLLKDGGYATGMFGKWGMSRVSAGGVALAADPAELGFDAFAGQLTHRDAHVHYLDAPAAPPGTPEHPYYPDVRRVLFTVRDGRTEPLPLSPQRYVPDELADRALAFVEANRRQPFFLYLPWTLPHAELVVPEDSLAPYLEAGGESLFPEIPWTPALDGRDYDRHNPRPRATYAGMVSRLSRDVGRLLVRLEELGLAGNTLVLFTSDNGPHDAGGIVSPEFFASSGPFSGRKWSLREGGVRVPFIASWPGRVVPGVESTPAALWDLFPTLLDFAGRAPTGRVDGASLRPLLEGKGRLRERPLYWETFEGRADYRQALRRGRFKALRPVGSNRLELYDLAADPAEARDLAARPALCPLLLELKAILNRSHEPSPADPGGRFRIAPLPLDCREAR